MTSPRVRPGRLRELGPINWVVWRVVSRVQGTPDAHLFSTLGRAGGLFRGWLHYGGRLLPGGGKLSRRQSELVILRVAHRRDCGYELDHHIRRGRRAGITSDVLDWTRIGPAADGWSPRERALLSAVDQLLDTRDIDDATWAALAAFYDDRRLLEIVLLAVHYDGLATTIGTLRIQRDFS
ncbi:MAG TPA: carboxymuconolactone decarboxylase family protein [Aldersonia sp.]